MRSCYACGSSSTHIRSDTGRPRWYPNFDAKDNVLCKKCFDHFINWPQFIRYRGKLINTRRLQVRSSLCQSCGKARRTALHHEYYNDDDILKDTFELCRPCHTKRSLELRQMVPVARPNGRRDEKTGRFI